MLFRVNSIYKAVLNIDTPRIESFKISHQFFVCRIRCKWILLQNLKYPFCLRAQAGFFQFFRIFHRTC